MVSNKLDEHISDEKGQGRLVNEDWEVLVILKIDSATGHCKFCS